MTPFKAVNEGSLHSPKTPSDPPSPMGPLIIEERLSQPEQPSNSCESPEKRLESTPNKSKVSLLIH